MRTIGGLPTVRWRSEAPYSTEYLSNSARSIVGWDLYESGRPGEDAFQVHLEFIGFGRGAQRIGLLDLSSLHQIRQGLVKGLHPVRARGLNGRRDLSGLAFKDQLFD